MKYMTIRALLGTALLSLCAPGVFAGTGNFGSGGNQFSIEFVPVGNPGNAPDTTGVPNPVGTVNYKYEIGKYEISRDMIIKASNAGGLGITLQDMTGWGGNGANQPATGVSWNEAARFVNWLNTSQGYSPAYKFAAAPGSGGYNANTDLILWSPSDPGYNAANQFRNSLANYFLPSADEWYKAAYYDPAGTYYNYATGSDTPPTAVASGTAAGTAVFGFAFGPPAPITQTGGLSPYGTMGQGGNVYEFEESMFNLANNDPSGLRGVRGGNFNTSAPFLAADARFTGTTTAEAFVDIGFRVAAISAVPEPGTISLVVLSCGGFLLGLARSGKRKQNK